MLRVLSGGNFVDILTLIAQGGGGGSVQSVSAPLALTNGVLSLGNISQQDWEDSNGIVEFGGQRLGRVGVEPVATRRS